MIDRNASRNLAKKYPMAKTKTKMMTRTKTRRTRRTSSTRWLNCARNPYPSSLKSGLRFCSSILSTTEPCDNVSSCPALQHFRSHVMFMCPCAHVLELDGLQLGADRYPARVHANHGEHCICLLHVTSNLRLIDLLPELLLSTNYYLLPLRGP